MSSVDFGGVDELWDRVTGMLKQKDAIPSFSREWMRLEPEAGDDRGGSRD